MIEFATLRLNCIVQVSYIGHIQQCSLIAAFKSLYNNICNIAEELQCKTRLCS